MSFDDIFGLEPPVGVRVVGYANDLAIVVSGRKHEELAEIMNQTIRKVTEWIQNKGLMVAAERTEAVMLFRDPERVKIKGGEKIQFY